MLTGHETFKHLLKESYEPKLGIFWVIDDKLIIDEREKLDCTFLSKTYTYPGTHKVFWTIMQRNSSEDIYKQDWMYYPRGRVNYDTKLEKYIVLASNVNNNENFKSLVIREFKLPKNNTIFDFDDEHYHKEIS